MKLSTVSNKIRNSLQYDWTPEIYGLGKAYRRILNYPSFIPLVFFSDHGVNIDAANIPEHIDKETRIPKLFLTWNDKIYEDKDLQRSYWQDKRIKFIFVEHPWVQYRKKMKYQLPSSRKGTIFFPVHTAPGYAVDGFNDRESCTYLRSLNHEYHPISICLHMHDRGTVREAFFQNAGFDVLTIGNSSSYDYVDKFYSTVSQFKSAISEGFGSQVAYLTDFGIPTEVIPRSINVKKLGVDQLSEYYEGANREISDNFFDEIFVLK